MHVCKQYVRLRHQNFIEFQSQSSEPWTPHPQPPTACAIASRRANISICMSLGCGTKRGLSMGVLARKTLTGKPIPVIEKRPAPPAILKHYQKMPWSTGASFFHQKWIAHWLDTQIEGHVLWRHPFLWALKGSQWCFCVLMHCCLLCGHQSLRSGRCHSLTGFQTCDGNWIGFEMTHVLWLENISFMTWWLDT